MKEDPFAELKRRQREMWASFFPTAMFTTPVAGHLVKFAGIVAGQNLLDIGTGTGVVALTAARLSAQVIGLDLTPALLEHARENARIAGQPNIVWTEGDAEQLPYACLSGLLQATVRRCGSTQPLPQPGTTFARQHTRPHHSHRGCATSQLHADLWRGSHNVRFGVSGVSLRAQGDRHKCLWLNDQRSLAMFTYPSVHDVGIDAVLQSHSSNGRSWLSTCLDNLQLEVSAVKPALRNYGGASVARHGMHDVHRAHYLNLLVGHQDGMPSRLR
jgi:SAM-dependent methyltransferase